jgi:Bacterial Ig-like domain (group 1)
MKFVLIRWVAALSVVVLSACGGGSGATSDGPFGGSGSGTGTGTGGGTGTSTNSTTPVISVVLSSQTVTAASPATVTAKVESTSGVAIPGQVVNFSTDNNRGSFSATSALTDANGIATVTLAPASTATAGADNVKVNVTVGTKSATASTGFQLTATNVTIASFVSDIGSANLDAYGQTALTVTLSGAAAGTPVSIAVSSSCVAKGKATLTPTTVTTGTGSAIFTYRDNGCGTTDRFDGLQASVTGTAANASLQLNLVTPQAASISFVSASPDTIFLKGSGFVENSNVTFQVRDANGAGVPGQSVLLEPTTLAGGLLLDGGSSAVTKLTDSDGKVLVRVNAGTVPTPVRVKATLQAATSISTVSSSLAIAVGLPSQNNFSLAQGTLNIEGFDIDGTTNTYTVIASDRLSNPVPAGTAINFVAEGGQVQAIRFTETVNGLSRAVANFQSSSPRPSDGRITILAYALGEESFLDQNGNNIFDAGEDYQDLGDVFLDRLLNGTYNALEDQFISLGISGTDPCRVATSMLLQLKSDAPSRAKSETGASLSTCVAGWGRAYVRKATQTVLSTSAARPLWGTSWPAGAFVSSGTCPSGLSLLTGYADDDKPLRRDMYYPFGNNAVALSGVGKTGSLFILLADANPIDPSDPRSGALNPVAAGSTVILNATNGMGAQIMGGSPVPSTSTPSGLAISFTFDEAIFEGTLSVTVISPSKVGTTFAQRIVRGTPSGTVVPCL